MSKTFLVVAAAFALTACECASDACRQSSNARNVEIAPAVVPPVVAASAPRFAVQRVDVVRDDLAYGGQRGIYVITDRATGREFVGLSGVGIAETGSHTAGKISSRDER